MISKPTLDFAPLGRAIDRLEEGLQQASSRPDDGLLRDGVIQRFEFTYELCWKLLLQHLESVWPDPSELEGVSFPALIRHGRDHGLLRSGLELWKDFRQARGVTSHIYDEDKSLEVFAMIPGFLEEARFLFLQLRSVDSG